MLTISVPRIARSAAPSLLERILDTDIQHEYIAHAPVYLLVYTEQRQRLQIIREREKDKEHINNLIVTLSSQ